MGLGADRRRADRPRARPDLGEGGAAGIYVLQAAIASLHVEQTPDWHEIAALYGELSRLTGSPVVELNRAIAVAEERGAQAGLAILERLALEDFHYLHATRGELLRRLGRNAEARAAYERALALVHDEAERRLLMRRLGTAEQARRPSLLLVGSWRWRPTPMTRARLDRRLHQLGELFLTFHVRVIAFRQRVGLPVEPFFGRAHRVRFKRARRVDEREFQRFRTRFVTASSFSAASLIFFSLPEVRKLTLQSCLPW